MAFGFLKKWWEEVTPQNEEALRRSQASIANANQKVAALGNNAKGVLGNPQVRQQWMGEQANNPGFSIPKATIGAFPNALRETGTGIGLGTVRLATSRAQEASGIYDLATPGLGTSRLSKGLDNFAKQIDQTAKGEGVNGIYRGAQIIGEPITYAVGGAGLKALGAIPKVAKATNFISKPARPVAGVIDKTVNTLNKGGMGSKLAATAVKASTNPSNVANMALNTGLGLGYEAGRGRDVSKADVALNVGLSGGLGVGMPVVARALTPAANKLSHTAPTVVKNLSIDSTVGRALSKSNLEYQAVQESARLKAAQMNQLNREGKNVPAYLKKGYDADLDEMMRLRKNIREGGFIGKGDDTPSQIPEPNNTASNKDLIGKPSNANKDSIDISLPEIVPPKGVIISGSRKDPSSRLVSPEVDQSLPKSKGIQKGKTSNQSHQETASQGEIPVTLKKPADKSSSLDYQSGNNSPADYSPSKSAPDQRSQDSLAPLSDNNTTNTPVKQMNSREVKNYVDDMNEAQESAYKQGSQTKKEKAASTKDSFKRDVIDDLAPIEDRLRKSIKTGAKVAPDSHISYQLDKSRRSEGLTDAYIRDNGLDKIIQDAPNPKEFDQYLIARHAKELDPEIRTGRNAAKDASLVKALNSKYEGHAKKLYAYNQKLLAKSVEYGLISRETAEQLKKQYPEYVPFNRVFNEDELEHMATGKARAEASISSQSAVKKIKGSKRAIESPLDSIIDKTRVVVEQGERNKAARQLVSYKDLPGNPFNLRELKPDETIGTKHTISFLDNGVKRTFETDKEIAEAAKHMSREDIGFWGRMLAIPARALRAGATGVNAGFAGANIVKDMVGAAINSKHAVRIANPKVIGSALSAALRHDGKHYGELMREGIAGTSFDMFRNARNLNVKEVRSHKNLGTRTLHNLTTPRQWYRTLEDTIGRSEDFGRALQFYSNKKGYLADGKSLEDATILAADQARHNSTNFFRHGAKGRNVNLAIPYWNAGVQGARIQTRRIAERPGATLGKMGVAIVAPSAMIAMNNYRSDQNRKIMDNIPEYEKENNIIIIGPNPKFNEQTNRWEGVFKFPVPPQHIGIHNTVQRAVASGLAGEPMNIAKSAGDVIQNYTTINPTDANKTINSYLPQGLKLITEPLTNKNFFTQANIVPDSMRNLAKSDQKYESTSGVAKVLGGALNISPLQIDNSLRTALGGAGQNAVNLADLLLSKAGVIDKSEVRGQTIPQSILGRFVGARGTSDGQQYFNTLDKAAKDNKLAGQDVGIFNALVNSKMNSEGEIEGKDERDALNKYQNLASHPNVAKAVSDAAIELSRLTGKPLDPLYELPADKQLKFYNIKAQNKDSQDQRDLENREASWYKDFSAKRREFFDKLNLKPGKSNRVPYPEASPSTQNLLDQYSKIPNGQAKWDFMDQHPEISEQFSKLADYSNAVRKGQGVNPLRTYPKASDRVQKLMDSRNFKDPEVSQYLQDMNLYNLTKDASLAQIQGNSMSSKGLKATQSLGRYSVVKNADGTYSLKYADTQGSTQGSGGSVGYGYSRGGRGGKDSSKNDIASLKIRSAGSTPTIRIANKQAPKGKLLKVSQAKPGKRQPIKIAKAKKIKDVRVKKYA